MRALLLILLAATLTQTAKADQLMYLSLKNAKAATEYLQTQKQAILWCACCTDEAKQLINVTSVNYYLVEADYYFVILRGTTPTGELVEKRLDLAYIHVNVQGKAKCLGQVLKITCDPCTKPFKWGV
ncbi:MAG: hypothetical protein ACKPB3_07915 [Bacteroidota bacterium]